MTRTTDHADEHMSDVFKMKVRKEGAVFSSDHPYVEIGKQDLTWGRDNCGVPMPEED